MMRLKHFCLFLLLSSNFAFSFGYIPRPCADNITSPAANCCPIPKGFSQPCGYPWRGACRQSQLHQNPSAVSNSSTYKHDIRIDWPARLFSSTCQCAHQFWGFDCGSCYFGYEGKNCQHRVIRVRREYRSLTAKQRNDFLSIIELSRRLKSNYVKPYGMKMGPTMKYYRDMNIHETAINIHLIASTYRPKPCNGNCGRPVNYNHNVFSFILWHRYLLLWWERELNAIAEEYFGWRNFSLPYWDYTDSNTLDPITRDFLCNPKSNSCRLSKYIAYCRDGGDDNCESPQNKYLKRGYRVSAILRRLLEGSKYGFSLFPSSKEILNTLKSPYYYSEECEGGFASYLEVGCSDCLGDYSQMHNFVHNMFDGDMGTTDSSGDDPLFFLHHSQLDRLLHRWIIQVKANASMLPTTTNRKLAQVCKNCAFPGIFPKVVAADMLVDLRKLGIDYDNLNFGKISEDMKVKVSSDEKSYRRFVCSTPRRNH